MSTSRYVKGAGLIFSGETLNGETADKGVHMMLANAIFVEQKPNDRSA